MTITPVARAYGAGWERRPQPKRDFRTPVATAPSAETATPPPPPVLGHGMIVDRLC